MTKQKQSSALSEMNTMADQAEQRRGIGWRIESGEKIPVLTIGEIAELLGDPTGPDYNGDEKNHELLSGAIKTGRLKADTRVDSWRNSLWPRTGRNVYPQDAFYRHSLKKFFDGLSGSETLDLWIRSEYEAGFRPEKTFMDSEYLNNFYRRQFANEALKRFHAEDVSDPTRAQLFDRCRVMSSEEYPVIFQPSDSELQAIFLDDKTGATA